MQTLANIKHKEVSVMIIQEAIELFRQHKKTTVKKSSMGTGPNIYEFS